MGSSGRREDGGESEVRVLRPSVSSLRVTVDWLRPQNESHSFCQVALSMQSVCPVPETAPTSHDLRPRIPRFSLWFP